MILSHDCKIVQVATVTAGAAGSAVINGAGVDMAGFDAVCFVIPFGAIVTGGLQSIKAQQSDDDGSADAYSDLEGTNQTIADTDDDKTRYIDIVLPTKRYVRPVVSRATQNSTIGGITAIFYRAKNKPISHGATVSGETFNGPAEGTA